jgi:V/A-type H+-transporting ATPase subunit A
MKLRGRVLKILHEESELDEIVKLVGIDALSSQDRLKMETSRSIREDFLHQLAFHEVDTYTSLNKQLYMIKLILAFYDFAVEALKAGASIDAVSSLAVRERIGRFKYVTEEETADEFNHVMVQLQNQMQKLAVGEGL